MRKEMEELTKETLSDEHIMAGYGDNDVNKDRYG